MLKGYADEHVVLALVDALRRRGMDVVRVQDRGQGKADDAELLEEALADQLVRSIIREASRLEYESVCSQIFFL